MPLRDGLIRHFVSTAYECGWSTLKNGELLNAAEQDGFEVLVTTDRNLRYQQNLAERRIAVVVICTTSWPRIRAALQNVVVAVDSCQQGSCIEVAIP